MYYLGVERNQYIIVGMRKKKSVLFQLLLKRTLGTDNTAPLKFFPDCALFFLFARDNVNEALPLLRDSGIALLQLTYSCYHQISDSNRDDEDQSEKINHLLGK